MKRRAELLLPKGPMCWQEGTPCNSPTQEEPTVFDTVACCVMDDGSSVEVKLPNPLPPVYITPSLLNVSVSVVDGDTKHSDVKVISLPPRFRVVGVTLELKSGNSCFVVIAEHLFEGHPYTKKFDILCKNLIAETGCKTSAADEHRIIELTCFDEDGDGERSPKELDKLQNMRTWVGENLWKKDIGLTLHEYGIEILVTDEDIEYKTRLALFFLHANVYYFDETSKREWKGTYMIQRNHGQIKLTADGEHTIHYSGSNGSRKMVRIADSDSSDKQLLERMSSRFHDTQNWNPQKDPYGRKFKVIIPKTGNKQPRQA
jgi:hypothetical protein